MSGSAEEGRDIMMRWIWDKSPRSVLDVGAGSGTYGKLLRDRDSRYATGPAAFLIGLEVWRPYIGRFKLHEVYDYLIHRDVRTMTLDEWPRVDVVILGDVLEHMTEHDAVRVWNLARAAARKAVYLSIPIIHYPQGAEEGNPFEEHVVPDWNHDRVLATFPGITWHWQGTIVGRYEAEVGRNEPVTASTETGVQNHVAGSVTGNVVQAKDIHGGLSL